ncbi:MAG TPA: GlsB/YeaQ/YmgE family stress response membrane protein [bacterium]|nr:GlsB/YeaQ/YmgE family stress response membrane protein [bacterium]
MHDLIFILVVGLVAGWLAGKIMKGKGFGLLGDLIVGVVGAVIGGWLFGLLGFTAYGLIGSIVVALIGAVILLYILRLIKK